MSVSVCDWEEGAIDELHAVTAAAERFLNGQTDRATLAGRLGQARTFLASESVYQNEENGCGGYPVEYFAR